MPSVVRLSHDTAPLRSKILPLETAFRLTARSAFGAKGAWAFDAFDVINARYFEKSLPLPWIQWGLTKHARSLGWCRTNGVEVPVITLHPAIMAPTTDKPWGMPANWMGRAMAFDVLLHECVHLSVFVQHGDARYGTGEAHNNEGWISEVNRIAPMLGFEGIKAATKKPKRFGTAVKRTTLGNIPYKYVTCFPYGYYGFTGDAEAYFTTPSRWTHVPPMPK
jgi:hypothetical protein